MRHRREAVGLRRQLEDSARSGIGRDVHVHVEPARGRVGRQRLRVPSEQHTLEQREEEEDDQPRSPLHERATGRTPEVPERARVRDAFASTSNPASPRSREMASADPQLRITSSYIHWRTCSGCTIDLADRIVQPCLRDSRQKSPAHLFANSPHGPHSCAHGPAQLRTPHADLISRTCTRRQALARRLHYVSSRTPLGARLNAGRRHRTARVGSCGGPQVSQPAATHRVAPYSHGATTMRLSSIVSVLVVTASFALGGCAADAEPTGGTDAAERRALRPERAPR